MPTYQYRCTECGSDLEAVQKFSDPTLSECPTCGGALRKLFNAVGVVFKGSGFYRTDSRATPGGGPDQPSSERDAGTKEKEPATKEKVDAPATAGSGVKSADGAKGNGAQKQPAPATTSPSSTGSTG